VISGQNSVAQVRAKLTFWPLRGIVVCGYGGVSRSYENAAELRTTITSYTRPRSL
jgi:hypothetical protein